MKRVTIIHPPAIDPRSPRLALPALAAYLRSGGIETQLIDLDLQSLLFLLSRASLERAGRTVRDAQGRPEPSTNRLLRISERLVEEVPTALATFRDPASFCNPHELQWARRTLLDGLALISAASSGEVVYSIDPISYRVAGVNPARFADLVRVTGDRRANLFADHWEAALFPSLDPEREALVGISLTARNQLIPGLTLARALRERGHFVVIGGTLITRFVKRLTHLPEFFDVFADGVVAFEGETALAELLTQLRGARDFSKVPNYLYRTPSGVHLNRIHVEDLARLPTPDFEGLPLKQYLSPALVLPILVGRGCYHWRCKFCEIPHGNRSSGKPYRARSPESFVGDLLKLSDRFDCRDFLVADEAVPPRLWRAIADLMEESGRDDLRLAGYARLEPAFTPELSRKLFRAGVRRMMVGLESGCQRTLDHMRKGTRVEHARPVLEGFARAGISFHVFAMIGLPEEDEASARETLGFFMNHADLFDQPKNSLDIHPLELQVASDYFSEADALGLRIEREALEGEFLIGVGGAWENSRGLDSRQTKALLAEFAARLADRFGRFHTWPSALWPALDEWGLVYGRYYEDRPFPYRILLPEGDEPGDFALSWSRSLLVEREDDRLTLVSPTGEIRIPLRLYQALEHPQALSAKKLLASVFGSAEPLSAEADQAGRALIGSLSRAGFLWLAPRFAGASASPSIPSCVRRPSVEGACGT